MSKFKLFMRNYLVSIVMIPSLVGIHWGWYQLQQNDALVPENERKEMPLAKLLKRTWNSAFSSLTGSETTKPDDK
ncbi:uncharacterized protein LOC128741545 [Sabethes cyaneus]|uniref:uncharacterized protein LOC128741545 n=1 Tax=Sabethes cyaneus TaxID=53552 RepID=UPI00221E2C87|nr:uncharacterized protein LOC128741545 [Sabethes cyaneus]